MLGRQFFQDCYYSKYNVWRPAMRSISNSGAFCQHLCFMESAEALAPILSWWTDSQLHIPPRYLPNCVCVCGGGGRRCCDQTNQRWLENMISPGEECECERHSGRQRKEDGMGPAPDDFLGPTAHDDLFKETLRCRGGAFIYIGEGWNYLKS